MDPVFWMIVRSEVHKGVKNTLPQSAVQLQEKPVVLHFFTSVFERGITQRVKTTSAKNAKYDNGRDFI
jgi:hypothetical protein